MKRNDNINYLYMFFQTMEFQNEEIVKYWAGTQNPMMIEFKYKDLKRL